MSLFSSHFKRKRKRKRKRKKERVLLPIAIFHDVTINPIEINCTTICYLWFIADFSSQNCQWLRCQIFLKSSKPSKLKEEGYWMQTWIQDLRQWNHIKLREKFFKRNQRRWRWSFAFRDFHLHNQNKTKEKTIENKEKGKEKKKKKSKSAQPKIESKSTKISKKKSKTKQMLYLEF